MSDKSSGQEEADVEPEVKSDEDNSSQQYSGLDQQQSPPKTIQPAPQPTILPVEPQRRRQENDEPWTLPFASPGFHQFQMPPPGFPQMTHLPNFTLNNKIADNIFDDFPEISHQMDQRRVPNPFRKVSGPMDMQLTHDNVNDEENLNQLNAASQGTQNQQIKTQPISMQQQYPQNLQQQQQMLRMPFSMQQQIPLMKNPGYQNMQHMMFPYNPQMMPQNMQQYKNFQQFMPQMSQMQQQMSQIYPPFMNNQFIPNPRDQESQQFQNTNTVSKELQNKVFLIVQSTTISSFQCNCKKSKCLKLYCECFANGQVCSQSCNCIDCKNRIDNQQERQKAIEEALIRNNDAFNNILNGKNQGQYPAGQQPPQIPLQLGSIEQPVQFNQTKNYFLPSQTKEDKTQGKSSLQNRVRKGCNCKKSNCKKKYCECYSAGLTCSDLCKCESCYNKKGISMPDQDKFESAELRQQEEVEHMKGIKEESLIDQDEQEEDEHEEDDENDDEQEDEDDQNASRDQKDQILKKKVSNKIKKIKKEDGGGGSYNKIQIKKDIWNKKPKKSIQTI